MYYFTKVTHGTTGVKTRTCGFQPTGARISVYGKDGVVMTLLQQSVGTTNGVGHVCQSIYGDTAGLYTRKVDNKIASQWEKIGGVWTEVIAATFDSFTATEFKYNVTIASSDYQFIVEAWD